MFMVARLICLSILAMSLCLCTQADARHHGSQSRFPQAPFVLQIRPHTVTARQGYPVRLSVYVKNVSGHAQYIKMFPRAVPFGSDSNEGCLMMRCRDQQTGKEVKYKWWPPGMSGEDAL